MALCMIVLCHILQHYQLPGSWYLTAGVQVFLCISGFLYGAKKIDDGVIFFKRGAWKILLDYWVLLLVAIPLFIVFEPGKHGVFDYANLFALQYKGFDGLQHTWFLPTILFCYLITPLLQRFAKRANVLSAGRFLAETMLLGIVLQIVLDKLVIGFNAAWVFCFIIAYLFASRKNAGKMQSYKATTIVASIFAVIFNGVKIYINTYLSRPTPGTAIYYFHVLLEDYAHATFGIAVFFLAYTIFSAMRLERSKAISAVLRFSDCYSYDMYLVHYIWIEATFGVMAMPFSPYGDLAVILFGTALGAILLHWLSGTINQFIRNRAKPKLA